jgi:hypothetical protein
VKLNVKRCTDVVTGFQKKWPIVKREEEAHMTQTIFAQFVYGVTGPALMIASVVVEAKQEPENDKLFGQALFDMALLCVALFAIYQVPIKAEIRMGLLVIAGMGLALFVAATRASRTLLQAHRLTQQKRRMRGDLAHFNAESSTD